MYFGKGKNAINRMTSIHAAVNQLSGKPAGHCHTFYIWTTFSHPSKVFDDLTNNKTVETYSKGIPGSIDHKMIKLKWGNIRARTTCDLTAMISRTKRKCIC